MSKVFNPKLELVKLPYPPIPYMQKDGKRKDGTDRKPKWKVTSLFQGAVPANQYLWWYYYGDIPANHTPVFIDGNPLNNSKDNLILLTYKELRSFVSKSNSYYLINDAKQRQQALDIIKTSTIIEDIERRL